MGGGCHYCCWFDWMLMGVGWVVEGYVMVLVVIEREGRGGCLVLEKRLLWKKGGYCCLGVIGGGD